MICPHCKNGCKKYGFFGGGNRCQRYRCNLCAKTFSDIPYRPLGRLKTPLKKATRIVNLLVEGVGVRATARLTKTHPNTIQAVLEVAGSKSAFLLDKMVREVNFPFVQVDEMFCFVGCKEKNNVTGDPERGRQSIFLGVDADTKFIINWVIGKRTSCTIEKYMQDLKLRVARPFQLSTDGYELFEDEVKWAFYGEAAYGQASKKFIHPRAKDSNTAEGRYEPSRVKTIYKRQVFGPVRFDKISTSYGRLIPCELIVTVDSSTISTPIIGLITEDIYHAGNLIIPAGTEVHGLAQVDRARERIASGNRWTLVFQDGEEMTLNGVALDRDTDTNGTGWDITDGSAGLRGRLIKTDDLAEIKLFAATFLSGAAGALTANQQTLLGTQVLPTTQNAALEGAQSVLGTYAKQILDSIERDGFYVRVPAGKQFYLYVTQTIDRTDAAVGESRSQPNEINNPPPQAPSRRETLPIVPMQP